MEREALRSRDMNSSFRKIILNEMLTGQLESYVLERLRSENERPLAFDTRSFTLCVTGLKKRVYTGVYGRDAGWYMRVFWTFQAHMFAFFARERYSGDVVMYMYGRQKELCLLYTRLPGARLSPYAVAVHATQYLQRLLTRELLGGDGRFCNYTAISPLLTRYDQIEPMFRLLLERSNYSFFRAEPVVLDEQLLKKRRVTPSFEQIQGASHRLQKAFSPVSRPQIRACLETLILDLMKNCYNFTLCADILGSVKLLYQKTRAGYGFDPEADLDAVFNLHAYPSVEMLFEAVSARFDACARDIIALGHELGYHVQRAVRVIREGYMQPSLSLESISRQIGISPAYLSRAFNREMKQTLPAYIAALRLSHAAQLLEEGALPIGTVAARCGFSSVRYFSVCFRKARGVSPTQFRKKAQRAEARQPSGAPPS